MTYLAYPFSIPQKQRVTKWEIPIPSLLHLGAMKLHALAQRNKWKDYVDTAEIIREIPLLSIMQYAQDLFGDQFSAKNTCQALTYFDDIDYSEVVVWKD